MTMILLVDDNKVGREAMAKILRLHGHEVVEAADGAEGLEILNRTPCELVITDFVMPEVSGVQFIDQVQKKWPNTRIVMMSGYLTPEVGEMLTGDLKFLPKPVDVSLLIEAIESVNSPGNLSARKFSPAQD